MDARKQKIEADAAWELFQKYSTIIIGRGKKHEKYAPVRENKETILKQALGRSGNLRAPSLEIDGKLVVGFNEEMYKTFVIGE